MICLDLLTTVHYCNCMTLYQVISAWMVNYDLTFFSGSRKVAASSSYASRRINSSIVPRWPHWLHVPRFLIAQRKSCNCVYSRWLRLLQNYCVCYLCLDQKASTAPRPIGKQLEGLLIRKLLNWLQQVCVIGINFQQNNRYLHDR